MKKFLSILLFIAVQNVFATTSNSNSSSELIVGGGGQISGIRSGGILLNDYFEKWVGSIINQTGIDYSMEVDFFNHNGEKINNGTYELRNGNRVILKITSPNYVKGPVTMKITKVKEISAVNKIKKDVPIRSSGAIDLGLGKIIDTGKTLPQRVGSIVNVFKKQVSTTNVNIQYTFNNSETIIYFKATNAGFELTNN